MSRINDRIVVTGMAVNTALATTLDDFLGALLAGKSGVTRWRSFDATAIYSKIGGDLADFKVEDKLADLARVGVPPERIDRSKRIISKAPWSVRLSVLLALDAWQDAGMFDAKPDPTEFGLVVAGHNLQNRYRVENFKAFQDEPDYIDPLYALHSHDTTHVGCVSDALQMRGPGLLVGAACASGAYALRTAVDELLYHDSSAVLVVGAVWDVAPIDMHAMALMGAISQNSFDEHPERASRPFDTDRNGFVPAHGGGAIVLERACSAVRRGARIYAEVLGIAASSDASHLPAPSIHGQVRAMRRALERGGVAPSDVDYVNGHFTSTPLGDIVELDAIKEVFGQHAYKLKLNATKSLIGHTMGSSAIVELIGAILQMRTGKLHPTLNVDHQDPRVDLDVCANRPITWPVRYFLKNAFGFGGLNASILAGRFSVEATK